MSTTIAVPLWLVLVLSAVALWAMAVRLILPSFRWLVRRRVGLVLEEINQRLQIHVQPFKLTRRRVLIDRLIYDPEVMAAAEEFAAERVMPRESAMEEVGRYAREIVPSFNAWIYFRFGYSLARTVARALYRVRLGWTDEAGLAAIEPGSTVVFVMNHRSNMDYVLVSYLAAERTALSYAVGEWARIWPLSTLIRATGAYFVRRRSRNGLYRKVLERYVQMATERGVTQAIYPEGRLSRDGHIQEPRLGLLDYMLRGFDPGGARDIVFVPVGINYDRVLEDRTLLRDLDPDAERKGALTETFMTLRFLFKNFALLVSGRWNRFGYACVNFGTPLAVRPWLDGLDLRTLGREERFVHVGRLAEDLMDAVGKVIPVLPVPLVATIFQRSPERRFSQLEVKVEVEALIRRLEERGVHVYLPRLDREYAIEVGLRALLRRRIVQRDEDELLFAVPEDLEVLAYYARSISHLAVE